MLNIINNNIKMTRGDDVDIILEIYDQNHELFTSYHDGDKQVFNISRECKQQYPSAPIIKKEVRNNIIHLNGDDTKYLRYGTYYWDCEYFFSSSRSDELAGKMVTISRGTFILTCEVG